MKTQQYLRRTLTTTRSTDEGDVGARLDGEVEVAQHTNARARRVTEVDVLEPNATLDGLRDDTLSRLGVDGRGRIQKVHDIRRSTPSRRHVGHEGEHVAGLDGTEDRALEGDEELEGGEFEGGHQARSVPEDECDDEERHGLRASVDQVTPQCCPVRLLQGGFETLAVQAQAVRLASKRCNGADGSSGLASELSGRLVGLLVLLILENDDMLPELVSGDHEYEE